MSSGATYQKRQEGNATVFETTPAKAPKSLFMLVAGVLTTGWGVSDEGGPSIILLVLAALCWWSFFKDPRPKIHRQPVTFRVSTDGIQVGSNTYRKSDIEDIRLENRFSEWGGSKGILDWIAATRTNSVRKVAFFLDLHTGGTTLVLAGGLDQTTASGLLNEVTTILGPGAG